MRSATRSEFFTSLSAIHSRYGPAGIQEPALNDAGQTEVSDDTQMTLFTAAGLLESIDRKGALDQDDALAAVRDATLDWHALQMGGPLAPDKPRGLATYTVLAKSQAPGTTCMGACNAGATGTPERPINNSKGCGGVMRVAPVGLIRELTPKEAFELAARCAAQTHGHPSGHLSAGVIAAIISGLVDELDLDAAAADALAIARHWRGADETITAVELAPNACRNTQG